MDPAPTEIYTDGHTLSLHDALPICPLPRRRGRVEIPERDEAERGPARRRAVPARRPGQPLDLLRGRAAAQPRRGVRPSRCEGGRSEEHTSELQSLIRISYAVFCLHKKNKEHHNNKALLGPLQ